MDLTDRFHDHPSEETLEAYVLHHLDEDTEARVEEHLLLCTHCQTALEESEEYVAAMKSAATAPAPSRPVPLWERISPFGAPAEAAGGTAEKSRQGWSPFQLGAAFAAICLLAALSWNFRPGSPSFPGTPPTTSVELSAFRGAGGGLASTAPSGTPLELSMDAADLAPETGIATFRMELVDANGNSVWSVSGLSLNDGSLSAEMDSELDPGQYFVRIYRIDAPGGAGELMREAGLVLE